MKVGEQLMYLSKLKGVKGREARKKIEHSYLLYFTLYFSISSSLSLHKY